MLVLGDLRLPSRLSLHLATSSPTWRSPILVSWRSEHANLTIGDYTCLPTSFPTVTLAPCQHAYTVAGCHVIAPDHQGGTTPKAKSQELYTPSPFVNDPWEDTHFILELPWTTKGIDSIFVDKRFSREVMRLQSLPLSIVLKRAQNFENHFLRILLEKLGTKLYSSNSYHPQKNGQTEIENIVLSTIPRVIMKCTHNSRDEHAYNKVVHKTTNISTFEVVCGLNSLSPFKLSQFPKGFMPKEELTNIESFKMRIKEHIQRPKEKYCKKLPKTKEKQNWQLHKIGITASTNSFALFDNP